MKLTRELSGLRDRLGKALRLDGIEQVFARKGLARAEDAPQWAIVYRTANGFCCVYRGQAVELPEMLDVQIWAEEMDVQTWFIGL
ncbi:hypothetical protein [Paraburkholderia phenoliruptrix]|uniref:hypothetical protein n=1 Tax=Paraburkholderia phenoliruptrix TaxID=252970 RepID=UPI003D984422